MMLKIVLTLAFISSAAGHIVTDCRKNQGFAYVLKPLTLSLAMLLVVLGSADWRSTYTLLILGGLFFSMIGDTFLMLQSDQFIKGLIAFLVAHLFYIRAFSLEYGLTFHWELAVLSLVLAGLILRTMWSNLGSYRIPVLVYATVLLAMFWQAAEWFYQGVDLASGCAVIGAAIFVASDATLAHNRFIAEQKGKQILVLFTYYTAQLFIVYSGLV